MIKYLNNHLQIIPQRTSNYFDIILPNFSLIQSIYINIDMSRIILDMLISAPEPEQLHGTEFRVLSTSISTRQKIAYTTLMQYFGVIPPSTIHKNNIAGYSMSSPRAQCLLYENGQRKSLVQRISIHFNDLRMIIDLVCHSHFV